MRANYTLAFKCCTHCLISNVGPFEDIEKFDLKQWGEIIDTLDDLRWNAECRQKNEKSADAAEN